MRILYIPYGEVQKSWPVLCVQFKWIPVHFCMFHYKKKNILWRECWKKGNTLVGYSLIFRSLFEPKPFSFGRVTKSQYHLLAAFFPPVLCSSCWLRIKTYFHFHRLSSVAATKANAFNALVSECELILMFSVALGCRLTRRLNVTLFFHSSFTYIDLLHFFLGLSFTKCRCSFSLSLFLFNWKELRNLVKESKKEQHTNQNYGMSINMRTEIKNWKLLYIIFNVFRRPFALTMSFCDSNSTLVLDRVFFKEKWKKMWMTLA